MSVIAYTLLLLGCADDGSACERIAAPEQTYASSAQCEAQVEAALGSETALRADYPVVAARCAKVPHSAATHARGARTVAVR
jgi:hypothetical protein